MSVVTVSTKRCTRCNVEKPLDAFTRLERGSQGRRSWCKPCTADHIRERRATEANLRQRDRDQSDAYHAAEIRVREAHRDEFERYYAEELADRGWT